MKKHLLSLTVNNEPVELACAPNATLLEVLRDELELTGVKEGCSEGVCGACTVLMDGYPIRSCLTLALEADGRDIETIEGVASDGGLHPIQQAFIDQGAVQCGFLYARHDPVCEVSPHAKPRPHRRRHQDGIGR